MGFREFAGWLITILGLLLVGIVAMLAVNRYVFEAMALSLPSLIVFRGGISLVRMGSASRLAARLVTGERSD